MSDLFEVKQIIFAVVAFVFIIQAQTNTEPCETLNTIDDWKRSLAFELSDAHAISDTFLTEGWYRITSGAGELMPIECVTGGWRCGTKYPIYLSNAVPAGVSVYPFDGEVVNRTAYAVIEDNCKGKEYTIQIKNCTLYLVYYLKPVVGLDSGYCFGYGLPCPAGQSSDTGFSPGCTNEFPNVTLNSPKIAVDFYSENETVISFGQKSIRIKITPMFKCIADDATYQYNYDIQFYINDVLIEDAAYHNVSYVDAKKSGLLQKHWDQTFKPNMLVKCSIQVRYKDRGVPGSKVFSDIFFAGIKVKYKNEDDHGFSVEEGKTLLIPITATMPIGCSYIEGKDFQKNSCYVALFNGVPKYQTQSQTCTDITDGSLKFETERCMMNLTYTVWSETVYVKVTARSDDKVANDRLVILRLYSDPLTANLTPVLKIWNSVTIPDIKIYISDKDLASLRSPCRSDNDPHMLTFDNNRWELQQAQGGEGEYIMYKHSRLPQQINVFFRKCNPNINALCNCGVAARSGDSLFIANFCKTKEGFTKQIKVNRYIASRICDATNLRVSETASDTYEVTFPSGTTMTFHHQEITYPNDETFHGIQWISIKPSQFDTGATSGLCGTYNGNKYDDFALRNNSALATGGIVEFVASWRIDPGSPETFFNPKTLPTLSYKVQQYCSCIVPESEKNTQTILGPNYNCQIDSKMQTCTDLEIPKTVSQASCISSTHRSKRATYITEESDDLPPMYDMNDEDLSLILGGEPGRWRNGLNENIAREKCEYAIQKLPSYSACTEYVPTVNASDYVEICVLDMMIMGSDSFLTATFQSFQASCLHDAKKFVNLTETNSTSPNGESKSIFNIIAESSCPNNCSQKGICNEGLCICTENAFGKDCSLSKANSPRLVRNAFEGYCDTSKKMCKKIVVPGMDFIRDNLTCKFRQFKLSQNSTLELVHESFKHPGTFSSSFLMYCTLPESRRKRSVDGADIAVGYFISVSNDGLNFTEELTMIIFDTRCVECNTSSLYCRSNQLDTCPTKSTDTAASTSNILAISIGTCLAVIVVAAFVILILMRKRCWSRRQSVNDSSVSLPNPSNQLSNPIDNISLGKYYKEHSNM